MERGDRVRILGPGGLELNNAPLEDVIARAADSLFDVQRLHLSKKLPQANTMEFAIGYTAGFCGLCTELLRAGVNVRELLRRLGLH